MKTKIINVIGLIMLISFFGFIGVVCANVSGWKDVLITFGITIGGICFLALACILITYKPIKK